MAKPRKVVFDVDGVLADFSGAFRAHLNRVFPGINIAKEPATWSWIDLGVTSKMFGQAWQSWSAITDVWTMLDPLPDAIVLADAIQESKYDDAEVWFLTSRGRSAGRPVITQTKEWILSNMGVEAANVIVVEHSTNKADVVRALGITHSIDDYAPTIVALNHQRGHDAYLMRKPWNEAELVAYDLPWVKDMYEFVNLTRKAT